MKAKGELLVSVDRDNRPVITFRPVESNVWMDRNELCILFGVYTPTVEACLDAILKAGILHVEKVCRYHRLVKAGRISYEITEVSLEVIVAMAFYMDSFNARALRKWFIGRFWDATRGISTIADTGCGYFSLN